MQILTRKLKCTLTFNKSYHFIEHSLYTGTMLIPLPTLCHLILKTALWNKYHFHFYQIKKLKTEINVMFKSRVSTLLIKF